MIVADVAQLPDSAVKRILELLRAYRHGHIMAVMEGVVGWERAPVRGAGAYKMQGDGL